MSNSFVCATQLVERENLAAQYKSDGLESDARWELVEKTTCELMKDYPTGKTEVEIEFQDQTIKKALDNQRGVRPPLSNEEIREKYRTLVRQVMDDDRTEKIEDLILNIERQDNLDQLIRLLTPTTSNPLA